MSVDLDEGLPIPQEWKLNGFALRTTAFKPVAALVQCFLSATD
jgi:hypothetical protein